MTKAVHMIKEEVIIGNIRISEIGITLRDDWNIGKYNRGDTRNFKDIDIGHMTEVESEIERIEEDLVGIEETVDLGIEVEPPLGMKGKREDVVTERNRIFYKGVSEKENGSK